MSDTKSDLGAGWWANSLEDIDREVARLAVSCGVRLFDPGVIQSALQGDATVCGTKNPRGFDKLRQDLMLHYYVRERAVRVLGEAATREVVNDIVANIRKRYGRQLGGI